MEEKKGNQKVGVNTSSGARKVRRLEEEGPVSEAKRSVTVQAAAENAAAAERMESAKARAERKRNKQEARADERRTLEEERMAAEERARERRMQSRERARERRAARAARRDMLRNETKVQRMERRERERQEKIAAERQNRELKHELALKRKEERMQKRRMASEERRHKREQASKRRSGRGGGIGGWLAAVISLGTVSLIMLTVITVGGVNMSNMSAMMSAGYQSNLYEITELSENLDAALGKLRLASGAGEQRRLLIDILVEAELMEGALERLPVDMVTTVNMASFVNRTAAFAREGLTSSRTGRTLAGGEETIEYMYRTNAAILKELQTLRNTMSAKDWEKLIKDGQKGRMNDGFENIGSNVIKTPSGIQDGPFSENKEKVSPKSFSDTEEITPERAAELAAAYFDDYAVREIEHAGDVIRDGMTFYNFTLRDERGREMYAQIAKAGGKLVMFDSYEKCMANNFSQEECVEIGSAFLQKLGMEHMHAVWLQENGTTANINFVYEQDGVLCYSDLVTVKVCETKGKVVGMEALPYYLNHCERTVRAAGISLEEAADALGRFRPATGRLALIPYAGSEALTYEFSGTYEGDEYFVYVDADTGEELEMFVVLDTRQGRLLR